MEEENDYFLVCPFCEIETEVFVNDEEPPLFCPMCGEEVEYQEFDEDEHLLQHEQLQPLALRLPPYLLLYIPQAWFHSCID